MAGASLASDARPIHPDAAHHEIFDADFHLNLHLEDLLEADEGYLHDPVVREKLEQWGLPPSPGGLGFNRSYANEMSGRPDHQHGRAITPDEVGGVMDEFGLDGVLLTMGQFHLPFPHGPYPEVKRAVVTAVNDFMLDRVVDVDRGIYGGLVIPSWDVDLALEELERHGDRDGVIAGFNFYPGYRPWGFEGYDPIFEALLDLDLPLQLHVDGTPPESNGTLTNDSKRVYPEVIVGGKAPRLTSTVGSLIFSGVFEKYPDLDVVVNEGSAAWFATMAHEADRVYDASPGDVGLTPRMRELDREYLTRPPSEQLFDNLWVTSHPIALPRGAKLARKMLDVCRAEDTFLFATDWPHSTVDPPNWVFDNPLIEDDLRETILHRNAESVYRFPS